MKTTRFLPSILLPNLPQSRNRTAHPVIHTQGRRHLSMGVIKNGLRSKGVALTMAATDFQLTSVSDQCISITSNAGVATAS